MNRFPMIIFWGTMVYGHWFEKGFVRKDLKPFIVGITIGISQVEGDYCILKTFKKQNCRPVALFLYFPEITEKILFFRYTGCTVGATH